jgi:hypothetical protein
LRITPLGPLGIKQNKFLKIKKRKKRREDENREKENSKT